MENIVVYLDTSIVFSYLVEKDKFYDETKKFVDCIKTKNVETLILPAVYEELRKLIRKKYLYFYERELKDLNKISLKNLENLISNYPKSYNLLSSFYEFVKVNVNKEIILLSELNLLFLKFERTLIKNSRKAFKFVEEKELTLLKNNFSVFFENLDFNVLKEFAELLDNLRKLKERFFNKKKYSEDYKILEQSCLLSFYFKLTSKKKVFILVTYDERLLSERLKELINEDCKFKLLILKPKEVCEEIIGIL